MSSNPAENAIAVAHVSKRFRDGKRDVQALSDVSFAVPRGTVFCILGPNGAGKTTLLRIMTTVTRPDTGSICIEGHDTEKETLQVRQCLGILAQENRFDKFLTLWHNLTLHAQMHGMAKEEYEPRITELLKSVDLYERRFDYHETFSGGMQRRAALIRSLIHKPKVLFLDEPSTGLDPQARLDMWETIEQFKKTATIILTTHYMEEADRLSDRVVILNHGKVVMTGTPTELKKAISPEHTFDVYFNGHKAEEYQRKLIDKGFPETSLMGSCHLRVTLPHNSTLKDLLSEIDWTDIHQVGETEATMETVYLSAASAKPEAD